MSEDSIPSFVKKAPLQGWGSIKNLDVLAASNESGSKDDCCSPQHEYHVKMQNYMVAKRQELKAKGIARDDSSKCVREIALDDKEGDGDSSELEAVMEKAIEKAMEAGGY